MSITESASLPTLATAELATLRRWLLIAAACVTAFGLLHNLDHAIRGYHIGWPLSDTLTPFTFSLLIYAFLLPGMFFTVRGRLGAGYWLAVGLAGLALVTFVHFVPTATQESPAVIYDSWPGRPVIGALAVGITFAIVGALVLMAANAVRIRRRSGGTR